MTQSLYASLLESDGAYTEARRIGSATGQGFYVSGPGKTISKTAYGVFWAFLAGMAVSALLILVGL